MIGEIIAAMLGTAAFSALFGVPSAFYPYCSIIGGVGWLAYSLLTPLISQTMACLIATMAVILLSRFTAIWKRCPVTIFLISGIFPLVPGAGVYWTAYYLVTNQLSLAMHTGYQAVKDAVAIVLGIVFIFEIPQKLFLKLLGRERM